MAAPDHVCLLGVPLDANSSYLRGCAEGPEAIRLALRSSSHNAFNEGGIAVLDKIRDGGDVALSNTVGSEADADAITAAFAESLAKLIPTIGIGGDHSVTYPILRAYRDRFGPVTVVHIDAHPDLYHDLDGNRLSHASPFARACEEGCIAGLTQIGIRTATTHQREQAARWDVTMISARNVADFDATSLDGPVYVSIDLDGLDPSIAPGVSHHEPGGLTVREVLDVLDALPGTVVGGDVVECNPSRDLVDMTAMVAAALVKELTATILRSSIDC